MRESEIERKTKETEIKLFINLDKRGDNEISTGIDFFDHLLKNFAFHAGITLNLSCKGDLEVDGHHSIEDTGIALGQAVKNALGERRGINRYGNCFFPVDESLTHCVIDISGRPYLRFCMDVSDIEVGNFDGELVEEFFRAFVSHSGITLHLLLKHGDDSRHMIESVFNSFGVAFRNAAAITEGNFLPTSKGVF
ncbi:MAG: imidazoleglycerol-phosphate dehydratase HisB [Clostridiales bacterium]|jgi:imidazoleglycerol-phosphate dehydratase|nr:imidazoleglycerol-phosphate dehydratase HisB [Clostridiales bacterium]